jgi:Ca2+-binding RTX toxin-like protein
MWKGGDPDGGYGTDDDDWIIGSSEDSTIFGDNGDDVIEDWGGENDLHGRNGIDTLLARGFEADALWGERGEDRLEGGEGNDDLNGGPGADALFGGSQADTMVGEAGNDYLQGDDGQDNINGGKGNDTLRGGEGIDWLYGGEGNDNLDGGSQDDPHHQGDYLFGEAGDDMLNFNPGTGIDVDRRFHVTATLDGGSGNDTVRLVNDRTVLSESPEVPGDYFPVPITANTVIYGSNDGSLFVYHRTLPNNDDGEFMAQVRHVEHVEIELHARSAFYVPPGSARYVELMPDGNGIAPLDFPNADTGAPAPPADWFFS